MKNKQNKQNNETTVAKKNKWDWKNIVLGKWKGNMIINITNQLKKTIIRIEERDYNRLMKALNK